MLRNEFIPFISIVIPTKNSEKYISDTLYSIKNQTYKYYEIIFVDNMSIDNTVEIIKNYQLTNYNIIKIKDSGVPLALNMGFNKSKGNILTWMNSDDTYTSKNILETISINFNNSIDLIYGDCLLLNENGFIFKSVLSSRMNYNDYVQGANLATGSCFFSKKVWRKFYTSIKFNWHFI